LCHVRAAGRGARRRRAGRGAAAPRCDSLVSSGRLARQPISYGVGAVCEPVCVCHARAGRGLLCARSGAIRITLLSRLATLARLHGSSISICSRPSALRPPVPSLSPSTVECTHSGVPVRSMSLVHHYTQPSQAAHTQNTQPHFTQTTHTSHVLLYMLTPQCEGGALCLHSILIHSCFISHSFGFIILIRWTTAPRPIRDVLLAAFLEEPISLQLFERIRRDCSCV
jgi:hypothetical protein